jgi:hypothetical protein
MPGGGELAREAPNENTSDIAGVDDRVWDIDEILGRRERCRSRDGGGIPEDLSVVADAGVVSPGFVVPVTRRTTRGLAVALSGVAGVLGCESIMEGVSTTSAGTTFAVSNGVVLDFDSLQAGGMTIFPGP